MAKDYSENRLNDDVHFGSPPKDIICKDCVFRKPDFKMNGKVVVPGYDNGYCKVYTPEIRGKPNEILFENAKCDYYMKDE